VLFGPKSVIFAIEMVAIRRYRLSKNIQTARAMLCFEVQFIFPPLNKSLSADRDRFRPVIVSSCYGCAQSCFDPFTMRLLKLWQPWVMCQTR
jgi:hypothetical protein